MSLLPKVVPGLGRTTVVSTYSAQPARVYRLPQATAGTPLPPAAVWEPREPAYDEVSDGLPHAAFAVIDGLRAVQAQPGPKSIRLNLNEAARSEVASVSGSSLFLHVHLIETVSRLQDDGPVQRYEITVDAR